MRGYQKRVIYMKNPGSAVFEEAYFVIKEGNHSSPSGQDIIKEANRIIEENVSGGKKETVYMRITRGAGLFFAGFLFSSAIMLLIFLI